VTNRRDGLALLAGELVVVALALVLVDTNPTTVELGGRTLPPAVPGATVLVVGAALGALRTAETVDAHAALGELGLGIAIAIAIATNANPLTIGIAAAIGVASATLRVDTERIHTVLNH